MQPESAASVVFGTGMMFHHLVAGGLPGVALALVLSTFSKNSFDTNINTFLLHLFVIHFVLSSISGVVLETGLDLHWPGLNDSLLRLVNHPFGRSAAFAFLLISILTWILLGKRPVVVWKVMTLLIFVSSFFLSGWSMLINSWMQNPKIAIYNNGIIEVSEFGLQQLCDFINHPQILARLFHHYQASLLIGVFWVLVSLSFGSTVSRPSVFFAPEGFQKKLLAVSLVILLIQPILGHVKFKEIAKSQPLKASAIEGYYVETEEDMRIYPLGITDPVQKTTKGLALPSTISNPLIS